MIKRIFKISFVFAMAVCAALLTSCEKENELTDNSAEVIQNFVDESVEAVERSGNVGRMGCYEFVFPISIVFPDNSTSTHDDYEDLRATIKAWKEANPDAETKPSLAFPVEVVAEDGAIITVNSKDELRAIKQACRRGGKKDHKRGDRCFKIVFPVSLTYPDGTTTAYDDRASLKTAVREWKAANPDAEERPMLAFPLAIELEDGTVVTVNSSEELQAQKESCAAGN